MPSSGHTLGARLPQPGSLRILFVNHTASQSGAENALLRLLDALPAEHERSVALPRGPFWTELERRGQTLHALPGTNLSFSLHPIHTPLGLARLAASSLAVVRAVRRSRAQVIHGNGLRAGLICVGVRALGGPPIVVQSHDCLPPGRSSEVTRRALARWADAVVGVTEATVRSFDAGLSEPRAEHVPISIDHRRFSPSVRAADLRAELGLDPGVALVGQIGQITPWKGQDLAIEALAIARRSVDVHLVIAGEVSFQSRRFDNAGYFEQLRAQVKRLGLTDAVHFLGQRADAPAVMCAIDLLLLPSRDEPFGTAAAESMAVGTPALVSSTGGPREYVEDGVSGRVLAQDDPATWARAICELLGDDELRKQMGAAAITAVERFDDGSYARGMLGIYERVVASGRSRRSRRTAT